MYDFLLGGVFSFLYLQAFVHLNSLGRDSVLEVPFLELSKGVVVFQEAVDLLDLSGKEESRLLLEDLSVRVVELVDVPDERVLRLHALGQPDLSLLVHVHPGAFSQYRVDVV